MWPPGLCGQGGAELSAGAALGWAEEFSEVESGRALTATWDVTGPGTQSWEGTTGVGAAQDTVGWETWPGAED